MPRLEKLFEQKNQLVLVTCDLPKGSNTEDLAYGDFKVYAYENGKYKGEISGALDALGLLTDLVDRIDWNEVMAETI